VTLPPLADPRTFTIYVWSRDVSRLESSDGFGMRPTLLESDRSFFQSAECAVVSILAHLGMVWLAVGATQGGRQIPTDEREARVFFLLPPDRVEVRARQTEILQLGKVGGDIENGKNLTEPTEGLLIRARAHGARKGTDGSGARGQLPFGPVPPFLPDTAFSVLEVDETVERYPSSAAPIYPPDLLAIGAEGLVDAIYVVDTTGQVDTTTIQVAHSDDPRFTASVLSAMKLMRFRPASRGGEKVRQLVQQQFRFRMVPASQPAKRLS
jgi:TonB family protein